MSSLSNNQQQSSDSILIRFLLMDSFDGQYYKGTSMSYVSLPSNALVADLRNATRKHHDDLLLGISSSQLIVYKNLEAFKNRNKKDGKGEPLAENLPLSDIQKSGNEAFVVAVQELNPEEISYSTISEKLRNLGIQFSEEDLNFILTTDRIVTSILAMPSLTRHEAETFLISAKGKVKPKTREEIAQKHSVFLNDIIYTGHGQRKALLYYAMTKTGVVRVAKIYNGHKEDYLRELEANDALDHPNLVKFIDNFSIQNDTLHIIIMPYYPRSVADMIDGVKNIPLPAIITVARSCYNALCYLHSRGYCFVDLKPSNIMLQSNVPEGSAVLVDYGAIVRIGKPVIEYTESFCLNEFRGVAAAEMDWICLGTTLAYMAGIDIFECNTISMIVMEVKDSSMDHSLQKLIISCLRNPSASKIATELKQFE